MTLGYVRVSTDDQARDGVSLAAQEERLRAFATATARELSEIVVDDGQSAKTLQRPGIQRILNGLKDKSVGTIIVLKLDRLTRSVRDLADLLDLFTTNDAALVSVSESLDTSSAGGRLMLNLLASVSQWEREAISERTAFALAHKRRLRQAYGHAPFGYRRIGDTLHAVDEEIQALKHIRTMQESGHSLRQIGAWLTEHGFMPRQNGKTWHAASVSHVLRSRMALEEAS
jgi:DNA invertase Pin-like site-specific DNA recombinase